MLASQAQINLQNERKENKINLVTKILFTIYLIVLYWILLFKLGVRFNYMGNRNVNLIPFSKPVMLHGKADLSEIILNIIIFIPMGVYEGSLFKRWSFIKRIIFLFIMSIIIEVLQFLLKIGSADITDVITNTLGGVIGLLIFITIEKILQNRIKAQKFINIIGTIGTTVMIILLILLKMNLLPIRYQ